MVSDCARDSMSEVGIIDRALRISSKVVDAMAQSGEKTFQLFLHRITTMVGTDGDCLMLIRSRAWHAANQFNSSLVDDVGGQRGQTRAFGDSQNCATLEPTHI